MSITTDQVLKWMRMYDLLESTMNRENFDSFCIYLLKQKKIDNLTLTDVNEIFDIFLASPFSHVNYDM